MPGRNCSATWGTFRAEIRCVGRRGSCGTSRFNAALGANTARAILRPAGSIELQYSRTSAKHAIVGISKGQGSSSLEERDLSTSGGQEGSELEPIYQEFHGQQDSLDLTPHLGEGTVPVWTTLMFVPVTPEARAYRLEVNLGG